MKYQWPETIEEHGYYMQFRIGNIEVLTHRNKRKEPCNNDWKNDDWNFINLVLNDRNCTPPQWTYGNLAICSSKDEIFEVHQKLKTRGLMTATKDLNGYNFPCREIKKLQYYYTENYSTLKANDANNNEFFQIQLYFGDTTFKYIEQVVEFNYVLKNNKFMFNYIE